MLQIYGGFVPCILFLVADKMMFGLRGKNLRGFGSGEGGGMAWVLKKSLSLCPAWETSLKLLFCGFRVGHVMSMHWCMVTKDLS